jgi:hypothetical protein
LNDHGKPPAALTNPQSRQFVSSRCHRETFALNDETIFGISRRILETVSAYQSPQRRGGEP